MFDEDFEETRRNAIDDQEKDYRYAVAYNLPQQEPEDGYSTEFLLWHMNKMIKWLLVRLRTAHERIDKLEEVENEQTS